MSDQPVAFDRVTGRRFVRAVKYFLTSEVRWQARGLFALLFAFAFTINGLNVLNSYVGRDFITAISHRDEPGFIRQAILYLGVFALSTAVAGAIVVTAGYGTAFATLGGVALFSAEAAASGAWLARFRFGPLEWLWRTVTYARRQPLRRRPTAVRQAAFS